MGVYLGNADKCRLLVSTSCAQNATIYRRSTHREVVGAPGDMGFGGGAPTRFPLLFWIVRYGGFKLTQFRLAKEKVIPPPPPPPWMPVDRTDLPLPPTHPHAPARPPPTVLYLAPTPRRVAFRRSNTITIHFGSCRCLNMVKLALLCALTGLFAGHANAQGTTIMYTSAAPPNLIILTAKGLLRSVIRIEWRNYDGTGRSPAWSTPSSIHPSPHAARAHVYTSHPHPPSPTLIAFP